MDRLSRIDHVTCPAHSHGLSQTLFNESLRLAASLASPEPGWKEGGCRGATRCGERSLSAQGVRPSYNRAAETRASADKTAHRRQEMRENFGLRLTQTGATTIGAIVSSTRRRKHGARCKSAIEGSRRARAGQGVHT